MNLNNLIYVTAILSYSVLLSASDAKKIALLKQSVFRTSTSLSSEIEKKSYGTSFVVNKNGLLATNYHVVSDVLLSPEKNKLFIEYNDEKIEAAVVAIDITNDLALIHVDKTFELPLKLETTLPSQGSKIYALGYPRDMGFSISEGLSNQIETTFPYQLFYLSIPLNSGMSGGPVVNEEGNVVAVNDCTMPNAENIGFSIPALQLENLIQSTKEPYKVFTQNDLNSIISRQLTNTQDLITLRTKPAVKQRLKLGNKSILQLSPDLDCWSAQDSDGDSTYVLHGKYCWFKGRTYLTEGIYPGSFEVSYELIMNSTNNSYQFTKLLNSRYNHSDYIKPNPFISLFSAQKPSLLSQPICTADKILNSKKTPFIVNICMRGYITLENLYDIDFKAVSHRNDKDALIVRSSLRGFTKQNGWKIIKQLLETTEESQ